MKTRSSVLAIEGRLALQDTARKPCYLDEQFRRTDQPHCSAAANSKYKFWKDLLPISDLSVAVNKHFEEISTQ
jgi:hypothetical protein